NCSGRPLPNVRHRCFAAQDADSSGGTRKRPREFGGARVTNRLLTDELSEPLTEARTATFDIDTGIGNLSIDGISPNPRTLVTGTLEYYEKQGKPTHFVQADHADILLSIKGKVGGRPWYQAPWARCMGGTDWQIHLSPLVVSDITAHTGG